MTPCIDLIYKSNQNFKIISSKIFNINRKFIVCDPYLVLISTIHPRMKYIHHMVWKSKFFRCLLQNCNILLKELPMQNCKMKITRLQTGESGIINEYKISFQYILMPIWQVKYINHGLRNLYYYEKFQPHFVNRQGKHKPEKISNC